MESRIVLTTDSGMCPNIKHNPIVIPDQITCSDGRFFKDNGIEITTEDILLDKEHVYKTAAPLLEDYLNTFIPLLEDGINVVHLSLGGGISSSSINNAQLIANELNQKYENKVHVIDSCSGSVGGTCYYEAAYQKLLNNHLSLDELIKELEMLKSRIQTAFYVPDATGFIRSGRDSSSKHSFSKGVLTLSTKMLNIASFKYRVDFYENGDLYLKKIFRSSKHNGMMNMIKEIVNSNNIEDYEKDFCVIANLYETDVSMADISSYLNSFGYFHEIICQNIGNVVAPYGCNDLCGISLVKKRKK